MAKEKTTKKAGGKKLSPYNKFMKDQLSKVKAADTKLTHKEAFKKVAEMWKDAPENPNNAKSNHLYSIAGSAYC
ncbi:hypothetical protein DFQ26_005753 [Actinomortierella ambigua]|nr:hypothetical protein DFQ26_005753 [Actinomortierella ambigua]